MGGFELDTSVLELTDASGSRVEMPPRAFDLLLYLIDHRERVVPKEELLQAVWRDVSVGDGSLSQGIWAVRRALRDTGGAQRVIRNVRGRGYRLVADVEVLAAGRPSGAGAAGRPRLRLPARGEGGGLLGRDRELARLQADLEEACAGRGRVSLVVGAPGIGKTRLVEELLVLARESGVCAYEGRCLEDEGMPPFWPIQQIARGLLREPLLEGLPALVGDGAGVLSSLIPELLEILPDAGVAPEHDLEQARLRLLDALHGLLARAAASAPLLLVVEDVHWADPATLRCLQYLSPLLERLSIHLVCTLRPPLSATPGEAPLAVIERQCSPTRIELSGFDEEAVAAMLRALQGKAPDPRLVGRVHDLTGGNPFFIANIARWLSAAPPEALLGDQPVVLPHEVRVALHRQLEAMPESARELLYVAAVLGHSFHVGDLRRVCRLDAEQVLERLEPALDNRMLREDGDDIGIFHFAHATIRATLYESLPRRERVRLHRRVAEAIERAHADDPLPRLSELAHHYYQAALGGPSDKARDYCRMAAERAYEATAFEEAVSQYHRALAAAELAERIDERARALLLLGLGEAMRGTEASTDSVQAVYADAAACARRIDDVPLLCEAAMRHTGRGSRRFLAMRDLGTFHASEVALLEEALQRVGSEGTALRARLLAWLGNALSNGARREERKRLCAQAVEIARRIGEPDVLAECLMLHQMTVRGPSALPSRIAMLDELLELARRLDAPAMQIDAHCDRGWAHWENGDLARAEADMRAIEGLAEEMRQPREKRMAMLWRARRLDDEGRIEEAEAVYDQVRPLLPPSPSTAQGQAVRAGQLAYFQDRLSELVPLLEQLTAKYPLAIGWRCGLTAVYAELGRRRDTARELERLTPDRFACITEDSSWVSAHARLVSAVVALGDREGGQVLYEKLAPYAERVCLIGIYGFCRGVVHGPLGELSTLLGDHARAERHLQRAIERNTELRVLMFAAINRLSYARMLRARSASGDRERALEQVALAAEFGRSRRLAAIERQAETLRAELG